MVNCHLKTYHTAATDAHIPTRYCSHPSASATITADNTRNRRSKKGSSTYLRTSTRRLPLRSDVFLASTAFVRRAPDSRMPPWPALTHPFQYCIIPARPRCRNSGSASMAPCARQAWASSRAPADHMVEPVLFQWNSFSTHMPLPDLSGGVALPFKIFGHSKRLFRQEPLLFWQTQIFIFRRFFLTDPDCNVQTRRILSGYDRGPRRRTVRCGGIGTGKHHVLLSEAIQMRGLG
jgi:hypothetical protein